MTFNVWSGEGSAGGRAKLAEIIQASDADIVGLQEMGASAGQEIADALGYHFHQQSGGGIQLLSRFPVIEQSPTNRGALFQLSSSQNAWVFNAHLAAFPYQPYDLRDGTLPMDEAAVIAAADAARGGTMRAYLEEDDAGARQRAAGLLDGRLQRTVAPRLDASRRGVHAAPV